MKTNRKTNKAISEQGFYAELAHDSITAMRKKVADGTATSQMLIYLAQLGSEEQQLKIEKLKAETELAKAKIELANYEKESAVGTDEILQALKSYRGDDYE